MKNIFAPALAIMARLKYPQRFALITVLFLLPLCIALFMLVSKFNHDIDFAQREIQGTAYLRPANMLFRHALNDWLLSQQAMRGLDTNNAALEQNQSDIDKDFADMAALDRQYGAAFGTTDKLNKLRSDWEAMKALPQTIDRQILYKPFTDSIREFISQIGDRSNLVLDSSLDTHYAMRTLVVDQPAAQDTIARLGVLGDQVVGSRNAQEEDKAELNALASQLLDGDITMRRNAEVAYVNDTSGTMKAKVENRLTEAIAASDALVSKLTDQILTAPQIMLTLDDWMASATLALNSSSQHWDAQASVLDGILQDRSNADGRGRNFALLLAATVLLVVAYMWVGFYMAVMRTVTGLEEAARVLASGNLAAIDLGGNDELSQRTAQALHNMASATSTLNSAMNARTNELTEVALLLAHMHDGVVITDAQGTIKVLNAAATRMLGVKYEDAINRPLVDLAHQPRLQDTMKAALASAPQHHMVDIALNNRIVSTTITFAQLANGNTTGLVVLEDVTELRTLQAIQQRTGSLAGVLR
jgi:PAS domain S-box-containing protein